MIYRQFNFKIPVYITGLCFLLAILGGCESSKDRTNRPESPVNMEHILSLVDSVEVDGNMLAYVYIYAEEPDYKPVVAAGEGITCVDDVGRLLEVVNTEITLFNRLDLLPTARGMTNFLLYMSRDDGLWYNFMWADGTINEDHRNSRTSFGWWAARGLRGLTAAYGIFKTHDPVLADTILARFRTCEPHLQSLLASYPEKVLTSHGMRASWLPNNAPDQAAEFLIALAGMQQLSSVSYETEIKELADGLMTYQETRAGSEILGMFYCFGEVWHGWGNLQAQALLEAYSITTDSTYLQAVNLWADNFLSWIVAEGFFGEVRATVSGTFIAEEFPQIAYGIGSSFKGIAHLSAITGNSDYGELASRVLDWFAGRNRAKTRMYDPETGRCFDGINDPSNVNRNSGAESTIEALSARHYNFIKPSSR